MTILPFNSMILLLFISIAGSGYSQSIEWAGNIGGADNEYVTSMVTDDYGNVYIAGRFNGQEDFDPGPATYYLTSTSDDGFVCKLNPDGQLVWAKHFDSFGFSHVYGIDVDQYGNVYCVGEFNNILDMDPGPGTDSVTHFGWDDIFLIKLSPSGNYLWGKQIGGGNFDQVGDIDVDESGGVFITGEFKSSADFDPGPGSNILTASSSSGDIFISKYDFQGTHLWAKQLSGPYSKKSRAISVDQSGSVHIVGEFIGTLDMDPGPGTYNLSATSGNDDAFICKLAPNGSLVWAKQLKGTTADEYISSVVVDDNGDVYTTGVFEGSLIFDPQGTPDTLESVLNEDIFITKQDSSGNFTWIKQLEGTTLCWAEDLEIGTSGDLYSTGFFVGNLDVDPGPDSVELQSANNADAYIIRLTPQGDLVWARSFDDQGQTSPLAISLDMAENVYTSGMFYGTTNFSFSGSGTYLTPYNYADIFIHKISQASLTSGNTEHRETLSVFPNPGSGIFRIEGWDVQGWELFARDGRKLFSGEGRDVNLTQYEDGVYILKINRQHSVVIIKK